MYNLHIAEPMMCRILQNYCRTHSWRYTPFLLCFLMLLTIAIGDETSNEGDLWGISQNLVNSSTGNAIDWSVTSSYFNAVKQLSSINERTGDDDDDDDLHSTNLHSPAVTASSLSVVNTENQSENHSNSDINMSSSVLTNSISEHAVSNASFEENLHHILTPWPSGQPFIPGNFKQITVKMLNSSNDIDNDSETDTKKNDLLPVVKNVTHFSDAFRVAFGNSWYYHVNIFGISFGFIGGFSVYILIHYIVCLDMSQRGFLMIAVIFLCFLCLLRSSYLLSSRLYLENSFTYNILIYEFPLCLMGSAVMYFVSGLGVFTETQWLKRKLLNKHITANFFGFIYVVISTVYISVLVVFQQQIDAFAQHTIFMLVKVSLAVWSLLFAVIICVLHKRMYKASLRRQSQLSRVMLTSLHIKGTHLPKKLPKPCLGLSSRVAFLTCVLSVVLHGVILVGVTFKIDLVCLQHLMKNMKISLTTAWVYQNVLRSCELAVCFSLTCGLFLSQCGHSCHHITKRITSLWTTVRQHSLLKSHFWHSPAPNFWRFSGSSRHKNGEHYKCVDMLGVYGLHSVATRDAVSHTDFTFERWEESRLAASSLPLTSDVSSTDAQMPSTPPVLKTFQKRSISHRISPQHCLQSHVKSSAYTLHKPVRTIPTTFVGGLMAFARSRRSSSSSLSSCSSLRPSPSKCTIVPSQCPEDDPWKNLARHCSQKFLDNVFESELDDRKTTINQKYCGNNVHCERNVASSKCRKRHDHLSFIKKPSTVIQHKNHHMESNRRKVKELSNNVLMVSRATQVYIPSPQKYLSTCVEQSNGHLTHHQSHDRLTSLSLLRQIKNVEKPRGGHSFVRKHVLASKFWQHRGNDGGSSTSCSSESAGNSFDVCLYTHSPGKSSGNVSSNEDPSQSQEFHEHYCHKYSAVCPEPRRSAADFSDLKLCSIENGLNNCAPSSNNNISVSKPNSKVQCAMDYDSLSNSSQGMDNVVHSCKPYKLRNFLPRFHKFTSNSQNHDKLGISMSPKGLRNDSEYYLNIPLEDCHADISVEHFQESQAYDINSKSILNHSSTLHLTLPLEKDSYTAVMPASKNHQDITPDSAVYLELNLPHNVDDDLVSVAKLPRCIIQHSGSGLPKSISFPNLYKFSENVEDSLMTHQLSLGELTAQCATYSRNSSSLPMKTIPCDTSFENRQPFLCFKQKSSVRKAIKMDHLQWISSLEDLYHARDISSCDSMYDSSDDSSVVSSSKEQCPYYVQRNVPIHCKPL